MEFLKELLNVFLCWLPILTGAGIFFWKTFKDERRDRLIYKEALYAITNYCELAYARMLLDCVEENDDETQS